MKTTKITALFLAAAVFSACAEKQEDAAAIVNGTKITQSVYEGTLQNLAAPYQQQGNANVLDNPQNRQLLGRLALQELITNEVLAQEAQKQQIKIDETLVKQNVENLKKIFAVDENGQPISDKKKMEKAFEARLKKDGTTLPKLEENIRKGLQAKALLNAFSAQQKVELQEQTVHDFYDNVMVLLGNDQKKKEALPKGELPLLVPFAGEVKKLTAERASVSAVFLATPKDISKKDLSAKQQQAKDIVKEIKDNKISFTQAIAQYSDDKNALKTNGEQLVLRGALPAELDKKVFESQLGTVVGPITQPEGIYILRVNEKRAETKPVYTQLRESIIKNLAGAMMKQNLQQYVKGLVANAKVEILVPEFKPAQTPAAETAEPAK